MREPKLLVFDLDGTLLDGDRRIPADVRRILFVLRDKGIQTTLATGRPFAATRRYIEELDLPIPVIVFNGAVVAAPGGECLWSRRIPKEEAIEALRSIAGCGLPAYVYLEPADGAFHTDRASEAATYIQAKDGVGCEITTDLARLVEDRAHDPIKLFSIGPRETLEAVRAEFESKAPNLTCVFSEHDMLEFLGEGVTKGAALHVLGERVGAGVDEIMAFGDNLNDLEMIREAGVGVAMSTAPEDLHHAADVSTQDLVVFLRERFADALGMEA